MNILKRLLFILVICVCCSAECPPSVVYKYNAPSHIFLMKKIQATCQYHVISWEVGKKKETLHSHGSFDRFTEASSSLNLGLKALGLEEQVITHSNVGKSGDEPTQHHGAHGHHEEVEANSEEESQTAQHRALDESIRISRVTSQGEVESKIMKIEPPHLQKNERRETTVSSAEGKEFRQHDPTMEVDSEAGEASKIESNKNALNLELKRHESVVVRKSNTQIERIVVIGERNTGTNWLFQLLEANFNVTILNHFCGWKHFFHHPSQCTPEEKTQINSTLVIVLWKNVFDWALSMHRNPYHMHMHFRNTFQDFIRRPMAMVDTYELSDNNLIANKIIQFNHRPLAHNLSTNRFDELFRYSSDEFCLKHLTSDMQWQYDAFCSDSPQYLKDYNPPFYELNPDTHRPFANILRMRSAKIKNFGKYLKYWMPNVEHIRFEELLSDDGLGSLEWMYRLSVEWELVPKLAQFELIVNNPKHPGELFNCTAYEANMYYSSCLRGLKEKCCSMMDVSDATFIHEQLDRALETSLEYVMPQVRDLCL